MKLNESGHYFIHRAVRTHSNLANNSKEGIDLLKKEICEHTISLELAHVVCWLLTHSSTVATGFGKNFTFFASRSRVIFSSFISNCLFSSSNFLVSCVWEVRLFLKPEFSTLNCAVCNKPKALSN